MATKMRVQLETSLTILRFEIGIPLPGTNDEMEEGSVETVFSRVKNVILAVDLWRIRQSRERYHKHLYTLVLEGLAVC